MLFSYQYLLNCLNIVRDHLPKDTIRSNEKIRVLAIFSHTTNSDFVLLAPHDTLARFTPFWSFTLRQKLALIKMLKTFSKQRL